MRRASTNPCGAFPSPKHLCIYFIYTSQRSQEECTVITILQAGKLRHNEVKSLADKRSATEWCNLDLNPGTALIPEPSCLVWGAPALRSQRGNLLSLSEPPLTRAVTRVCPLPSTWRLCLGPISLAPSLPGLMSGSCGHGDARLRPPAWECPGVQPRLPLLDAHQVCGDPRHGLRAAPSHNRHRGGASQAPSCGFQGRVGFSCYPHLFRGQACVTACV